MNTPLASIAQAKKVMRELIKNGANVTTWYKDGQGDSVKIQVEANGQEFLVAVEATDNLPVMGPDYNWTYDLTSVVEVMAWINTRSA